MDSCVPYVGAGGREGGGLGACWGGRGVQDKPRDRPVGLITIRKSETRIFETLFARCFI